MNERVYALFGVFGPLLVYVSITVSLVLSPWFSWETNALSDLGHSVTSDVRMDIQFGIVACRFFSNDLRNDGFQKSRQIQ